MKNKYIHNLNPNNLLIDDRSIDDFILYTKKLSKEIKFYNSKNKVDGSWYDLLKSDQTFLIAEIANFNITKYASYRFELISKYDESPSFKEKKEIFNSFYEKTLEIFIIINDWYEEAKANNLSQKSSKVELLLENVIQNKLAPLLNEFYSYAINFEENNFIEDIDLDFENFGFLWKLNKSDDKKRPFEDDYLNLAFKQLTLIFNPAYEITYAVINKSKTLLFESLNENDNHKPHIGLLFSFLKIFENPLSDLNELTIKHLDLYYKKILKLKPKPPSPNKLFVTFDIDENTNSINLSKGTKIKVGQYDNGDEVIFETDKQVALNNSIISRIDTFFMSENQIYDYHSKFNLVSGLYHKNIVENPEELIQFNDSSYSFSTLGEDQILLSNDEKNMDLSSIGFMIGSPVLKLLKSNRQIEFNFKFDIDSVNYLSDLIIDIANNKGVSEDNVFFEIFSNAFDIEYTTADRWINIKDYSVEAPEDWSTGIIKIIINLNKKLPEVSSYNPEFHKLNLKEKNPLFKFRINQENFYNPYSFLNNMSLSEIYIKVKVTSLKDIYCYGNGEFIDINTNFEMFGAVPESGDNLLIGCSELFNKNIIDFDLKWEYKNLDLVNFNLKDYYKVYQNDFSNDFFKFKITALSNYEYINNSDKKDYNLFIEDENSLLKKEFKISGLKINDFGIIKNYNIDNNDISVFNNNLETGLIKLELLQGFGSKIYNKVLNRISVEATSKTLKKGETVNIEVPNDPFSPEISDISIDYKADSNLFFDQIRFKDNIKEEQNSFYLISPFGIEQCFSDSNILHKNLVLNFNYEGELYLSFKKNNLSVELNLLFEILKSENPNYEFSRQINWYYSVKNGWKPFKSSDILYDDTSNLMKTGVISFLIPSDASENKNLFGGNYVTIKACSKSKSNQFSLVKSIRLNSVSASQILSPIHKDEMKTFPPFSVEQLYNNLPGITNIDQYLESVPGDPAEADLDFYKRVSELLSHKNRPVLAWDYEKFILDKFNWLSNVKCFCNKERNNSTKLMVLSTKKININENIKNIKLSASEKKEVSDYLKKFISPFVKLEIINPVFEDLWIKCKVNFIDISAGLGIQKLQNDLFEFICSWLYNNSSFDRFGNPIKVLEIINFLKQRSYVNFISGISIIHLKKDAEGNSTAFDSAVDKNEYLEPGSPWSLIIPTKNHIIDIINKNEYFEPEPVDFNSLKINEAFLITHNSKTSKTSKKTSSNNDEDNVINLTLKI